MKKAKYVIIGLIILSVLIGGYYISNIGNTLKVETYTVKKDDISQYIEETAVVKSENQTTIYSKTVGEVTDVNVEVGEKVKVGDTLLSLNSSEIDLEIKSLESKLEALRASYREAVKLPEKELINKAKSNVRSIEIAVEEGERSVQNSERLYNEGVISYDEYQKALNNLQIQKENLEAAKSELSMLQKGTSENIKKQYEANIKEIQYQLDILKKNKDKLTVKSPIDGVILETFAKKGLFVQPGVPLLEIGDVNNLYLESDILASEIGDVKLDSEVIIYSDDLGIRNLKGRVRKIHPKAVTMLSDLGIEQKRVKVEITIDESEKINNLGIGYEVDVRIITESKKDVLVIPNSSIVEFDGEKYVYIIENDTAKLKKVEIGVENGDIVEIISGLKEGEKVISNPNENIKEGSKVKQIN